MKSQTSRQLVSEANEAFVRKLFVGFPIHTNPWAERIEWKWCVIIPLSTQTHTFVANELFIINFDYT